jgi:hypothetical protein
VPLSTFLNGRNPSQLRGLQWLALADTGMLLSRTYTSDSGGGASVVWGTAAANIPCRIDPMTAVGRDVVGGRIDERSTHMVTVPSGTSVSSEERFVIASRGTFEVTAAREQTGELVTTFEVIEVT